MGDEVDPNEAVGPRDQGAHSQYAPVGAERARVAREPGIGDDSTAGLRVSQPAHAGTVRRGPARRRRGGSLARSWPTNPTLRLATRRRPCSPSSSPTIPATGSRRRSTAWRRRTTRDCRSWSSTPAARATWTPGSTPRCRRRRCSTRATRTGFSAAADAVLDTDVDPAFLLICHDDVALAPDTVRQLVVESLRSNAGIAGPKLVDWHRPDRLQHVAYTVDRFGVAADVVDPGELDQEQYDAVADVFAVPSACLLIRTGLFRALGGFDPEIAHRGEEIDLCWRAQLLGARVLVVPAARVRHRENLYGRTGVDDIRRSRARHQLRTVLVTGSRLSLLLTLPLLALLHLGEAVLALLAGRAFPRP